MKTINPFASDRIRKLTIALFTLALLVGLNSCLVTSLNPIYFSNNLIYKPELCGKWVDSLGTQWELIETSIKKDEDDYKSKEYQFFQGKEANPETKSDEEKFFEGEKTISETISKEEEFFHVKHVNPKTPEEQAIHRQRMYNFFMEGNTKYYTIKINEEGKTATFTGKLVKLDKYLFLDVLPEKTNVENIVNHSFLQSHLISAHGIFKVTLENNKIRLNYLEPESLRAARNWRKFRFTHVKTKDNLVITAKTKDIQKFLIKYADSDIFSNEDSQILLTKK
ncbi:MAG: hypothetical protein ACEPOZ_09490 [Marinifilaceae bacterium]